MESPKVAICPKCNSTSLSALKRGYNGKKAVGAAILAGPIGLVAGMHGSNEVSVVCLNCGASWDPKKLEDDSTPVQERSLNIIKPRKRRVNDWRFNFYKMYENQNYEQALNYYNDKNGYSYDNGDVHQFYKDLKRKDKLRAVIILGSILLITVTSIYFIL